MSWLPRRAPLGALLCVLAIGLTSCVGLQEKATTAPYTAVSDLLDPVETRLEAWTPKEDAVHQSLTALRAWPEGEPYTVSPSTQEWVGSVCDTHDFYAPGKAEGEFELGVWLRTTDELREWFLIEDQD